MKNAEEKLKILKDLQAENIENRKIILAISNFFQNRDGLLEKEALAAVTYDGYPVKLLMDPKKGTSTFMHSKFVDSPYSEIHRFVRGEIVRVQKIQSVFYSYLQNVYKLYGVGIKKAPGGSLNLIPFIRDGKDYQLIEPFDFLKQSKEVSLIEGEYVNFIGDDLMSAKNYTLQSLRNFDSARSELLNFEFLNKISFDADCIYSASDNFFKDQSKALEDKLKKSLTLINGRGVQFLKNLTFFIIDMYWTGPWQKDQRTNPYNFRFLLPLISYLLCLKGFLPIDFYGSIKPLCTSGASANFLDLVANRNYTGLYEFIIDEQIYLMRNL